MIPVELAASATTSTDRIVVELRRIADVLEKIAARLPAVVSDDPDDRPTSIGW